MKQVCVLPQILSSMCVLSVGKHLDNQILGRDFYVHRCVFFAASREEVLQAFGRSGAAESACSSCGKSNRAG